MRNTKIYINIERTLFEAEADYSSTVKVAENPEEIKSLLEPGSNTPARKTH